MNRNFLQLNNGKPEVLLIGSETFNVFANALGSLLSNMCLKFLISSSCLHPDSSDSLTSYSLFYACCLILELIEIIHCCPQTVEHLPFCVRSLVSLITHKLWLNTHLYAVALGLQKATAISAFNCLPQYFLFFNYYSFLSCFELHFNFST